MKLGFLSTMASAPWGGSEFLWMSAATEALAKGLNVVASVERWDPMPAQHQLMAQRGVTILQRPRPVLRRLRRPLRMWNPLRPFIKSNPDALIISQGGTYDLAQPDYDELVEWLGETRIPYVVVCHGNNESAFPSDEALTTCGKVLDGATRACFISRRSHLIAERQLARPLPNAVVLRNPVNLLGSAAVPWPTVGCPMLATVARIEVGVKGHDVLLEVLADPYWSSRPWQLSIAGEGPQHAYIHRLVRFFGLGSRVSVVGQVNDVRALWAQHHLLVLPSRTEGLPLAIVEAMVCGRPVVATDVGGTSELIAEDVTGFLAAAPTPGALHRSLVSAFLAFDRWREMGLRAHDMVCDFLDPNPGQTLLALVARDSVSALEPSLSA